MLKFPLKSLFCISSLSKYSYALAIPLVVGSGVSVVQHQKSTTVLGSDLQEQLISQGEKPAQIEREGNPKPSDNSPESSSTGSSKDDESDTSEPLVLITEVIIEGLDGHPEKERLEFATYDAMSIRPGSNVSRKKVKLDLDAIYSTGWFSGVRIEPINGPLGVQLVVQVTPNPVFNIVEITPENVQASKELVRQIFQSDYGKTLNLNSLQSRIKELRSWYINQGYSLARISGPNRITEDGSVQLKVIEGSVEGIQIQFLNNEGELTDDKGRLIRGKTRPWVIQREISMKSGDLFNRNTLEKDIKRLYKTSLFNDIKVTLKPVIGEPGRVTIVLGITEQSTGSLTGGVGFSQGQGAFGQLGLAESNLLGRAWKSDINVTYGQYGGLINFGFIDPWIKGDKYRTSFRTSFFLSREVPQEFRSQSGGSFRSVSEFYDSPNTKTAYNISSTVHGKGGPFNTVIDAKNSNSDLSWFSYEGDSVAIQRTGGKLAFSRPLNGGNPYKKSKWTVLAGLNLQSVKAIDYAGNNRPYGVLSDNFKNGSVPEDEIICVAFNCADENVLFGIRTGATYNTLNDSRNPTSGNFLNVGTEQFISTGNDSPTFNRAKIGYSYFLPVGWLKFTKGCRPKRGEKANCPQAVAFQVKAGTTVGELPPYEAFCLGGSSSVRGWNSCDLAVGRSFGEATVEYRFPIWKLVAGSFFADAGTDFGSQENVPGQPGKLLGKDGSGYSLGSGLIINTPVGPIRLEAASRALSGDWRYNIGVGWKF